MKYNIAVIPGDGIGPEVIEETTKVLKVIGDKFGHRFDYEYVLAGGCAIDKEGTPLSDASLEICKKSDAVLLGAVGGPKWDVGKVRPEQGLFKLRSGMNLYCNLRPAVLYAPLKNESPLKDSIVKDGIDICIVRELTGGIYFGQRGTEEVDGVKSAYDTERYNVNEITRIAKSGFEIAMKRNKKLTSVDKANVLDSSKLWRSVVNEIAKDYPEVEVNHLYVDNAAMQIVRDPNQFDVIVTSNLFGDILSDEASMVTGSIGLLPSASLGDGTLGMYEPIHGSAPDIAGQGIANPLATILSAAMMLRYSFSLEEEAKAIENAVLAVLEDGYRTGDIMTEGKKKVGTVEMGKLVCEKLQAK
ncbi:MULTISPECIES: 3-isopropylmalate dehydrogenase [unclassified Clostridium]|uniref:3-isopropylmalate dehydrogenase n=1 Tax=unclassified Clostridium TaxID=2614128 RepID=UPI00023AF450|nr:MULTISPECIES: 3-isopropylmalate dehydrogenase [unclassified Clostridium]EHI97227.1 3-isopropylmalate dehydrogenase [Clostridium sp. DL-VIII]OOM79169.1 3-isopropylmalate dehydrogenase [Clostridium sp. BL-8]